MPLTGQRVDDIQAQLEGSLIGETITGPSMSVALKESSDYFNGTQGPIGCTHGGVSVKMLPSGETDLRVPQISGGLTQRVWATRFELSVTISVDMCPSDKLYANMTSFHRQLVNLVEAGMEVAGAPMHNMRWIGGAGWKAAGSPDAGVFLVWGPTVEIRHFWRR